MKHITTGLFYQSITLCISGEERCLCLKNHTLDKAKNKILKMIDNCYKLLQQMQCLCFSRILPKLDSADLAVCGSKSAQVNVQPRQCTEKYGKERREPWFMEFLTTCTKYGCFSAVEILATQSILWVWMWHSILFWSFFFFFLSPFLSCYSEILEEDSQLASFHHMVPLPTALLRWGEATQPWVHESQGRKSPTTTKQ